MLKIGVLASHTGTGFQAIADACAGGRLDARVALLICNNSNAQVMQRAGRAGIAARHLSLRTHPRPGKLDEAIREALTEAGVNVVVLAGYVKKVGPRVLDSYRGRIVNLHPSLLPRHGGRGFYGARVHAAVLKAGDTETGATVHLVTEAYDEGSILLQGRIPVLGNDTPDSLAARLRPLEHELLIEVLRQFTREDKA